MRARSGNVAADPDNLCGGGRFYCLSQLERRCNGARHKRRSRVSAPPCGLSFRALSGNFIVLLLCRALRGRVHVSLCFPRLSNAESTSTARPARSFRPPSWSDLSCAFASEPLQPELAKEIEALLNE